jgi:molybdate/tungstate transport system substrate-binding protein
MPTSVPVLEGRPALWNHPAVRAFSLLLILLAAAGCRPARKPVVVFAAASLARVFSELKTTLEEQPHGQEVRLSVSSSQEACRKVAELGHRADIVATADDGVIDRILRPQHATFTIQFATNEVVLAHLEHSKHTEEITAASWPAILLRPEVRLGMVSSDLPLGRATVLAWQRTEQEARGRVEPDLAGRLRARCRPEHVTHDEGELLQLLQTRAIDYAFVYRSLAEEHNLKLVELSGVPPVLHGVTVPRSAPNPDGAVVFLRALLGEPGQRALRRSGFRPLAPAPCRDRAAVPEPVRGLTR